MLAREVPGQVNMSHIKGVPLQAVSKRHERKRDEAKTGEP